MQFNTIEGILFATIGHSGLISFQSSIICLFSRTVEKIILRGVLIKYWPSHLEIFGWQKPVKFLRSD